MQDRPSLRRGRTRAGREAGPAGILSRDRGERLSIEVDPLGDVDKNAPMRYIAEHSLGESARISCLSQIREFVLGAQDGLLVPLGAVTGMAAANPARSLIVNQL